MPCGDASCDIHAEACLTQTLLYYWSDASSSTYTCIGGDACAPIRCACINLSPYEQTTSLVSCGCASTDAGVTANCTSYAGCYGSPPTRVELLG